MSIFDKILREVFENVIMKTKLFEMAHDRQKALDILRSLQGTIANHFIKVMLFPDHQDCEHWEFELETYFNSEIDRLRLKPKNKKLKYSDYFDVLFDEPLGHPNAVKQSVTSLYKGKIKRIPSIPDVDYEEVRLKLKAMYEELCDDLSIDNYDGIEKYIEMLKEK